jgi:insulysin
LNAVDSENKKNLQSDMWRLSQLVKTLSNSKHPYHHFSTGNLKTLKEDPEKRGVKIRDEFIKFYERHYSANRMKLVVLGRESLEELEDWVVDLFSGVKNQDLPLNRWDEQQAMTENELTTEIFAKPVMETRSLEISFPWQDEEDMYETQPARFVSHLIGHEGPGSILAYLKDQGLANTLSAGYHNVCPGTSFFEIEISLTPEGLTKYHDVVKIVFQYISLMKENPPLEWMHEEMKNMGEVDFRFRQKSPASKFTSSTSAVMQKPIPRPWLLSNVAKYRRFDPKAIVNAMQFLRHDNFRLLIVSQDYPGDWDAKEKWYGTDYRVQKIPIELQTSFRQALEAQTSQRPADLHLPHKNEFIPTRLDVEKLDIKDPAKTPKLLRNDPKMRLWWKKDDQFWVPKANINVLLRNPLTYASPSNYVRTVFFTALVKDALTSYSYDAEISGLVYSVSANPLGMDIAVHGYNDKLSVLLEKILLTVRDLEIRQDRFDIIKERMERKYRNWAFQQPYYQVGEFTRWVLNEKGWIVSQFAEELPHITLGDLRSFAPQLIQQAHIELLAHGNLYRSEAVKIGNLVETTLSPRPLSPSQWHLRRNLILPPGANYVFRHNLPDPNNVNNCIEYYLHIGPVLSPVLRAKTQLFAQIVEEPAFDVLRTKEQLGYVVWSGVRPSATTIGFRVLIQSERSPEYLEERIERFLADQGRKIREMGDEEFEGHKRSLVMKRLEKLKNLDSETGRLWGYIGGEWMNFLQVDADVAEIRKLKKEDVTSFFGEFVDPEAVSRAKVAIHLVAGKKSEPEVVDPEEQRSQFISLLSQVLSSAGATIDEATLTEKFEKVELSDKEAIISTAKEVVGDSLPANVVKDLEEQLEQGIPELMLALNIGRAPPYTEADVEGGEVVGEAEAETNVEAQNINAQVKVNGETNGEVEVAKEKSKPVLIGDVHSWKAGLQVSEAPVAVVDLREFEDLEAKL